MSSSQCFTIFPTSNFSEQRDNKNFVANAFMMHKPVFAGFGLACSKLKIISHSKASENMDLAFLLVQKDFIAVEPLFAYFNVILFCPFSQCNSSMVGEQGNRTSGTTTASVPQGNWWRRIHNLNSRSRLQEVSGSLNCAEKFSSLVSCHRGYGSVAFYAVFSLFILTFLYAIWKIVSAHSRSARRPVSSNSTSVAKLSPTAHAPTGYVTTHAWLQKENFLDHFHQSVKKISPFQNEAPQEKPSPAIFLPPENGERSQISSVTGNIDFPTRGHSIAGSSSPSWTSRGSVTKPLYSYYPGAYSTFQPPLNNPPYLTAPYPPVVNPLLPTASYPNFLNPYVRPPFLRGVNNNERGQFRIPDSNRVPYNGNSYGIFTEKVGMSSPLANTSYRPPYYYFSTNKNMLSQGAHDDSYYGDKTEDGVQSSPSPLISFLKESYDDAQKSMRRSKKSRRKRKKLRKKSRTHEKKKQNHMRNDLKYDYIEDVKEKNKKNSEKTYSTIHHNVKHHREAVKQLKKKNHETLRKNRQYVWAPKPDHRTQHVHRYKHTHTVSSVGGYHHVHHRVRKHHLKVNFRSLNTKVTKYRRTSIPHVKKTTRDSYLKSTRHERSKVHAHRTHHHGRNVHVHHSRSRRHHNLLDFRLYRLYRKHHSVNEEIHGKWNISRHRVSTCKVIDQFSTRGTVKMTRTRENSRYLHTLLICRPVRLRLRKRGHRRRYSIKYAQLCNKKWYMTKGIILVDKTSNDQVIPRYNVKICQRSYAHAAKLLPANNKETKIWNISDFVRKMERDDEQKNNDKSSFFKHGHKHHNGKKRLKKLKKWNKERKLKRGHETRKERNSLSRMHHLLKPKKHRIVSAHKSKPSTKNHLKLHEKQSHQLKKLLHKRRKFHGKKENKASVNKDTTVSKPKGGKMDSDKEFYGKLLKVLKLAKIYDSKKSNGTRGGDIFDSLEAVLTQSKNATKQSSRSTKKPTVETRVKKDNTSHHHISHKGSPKNSQEKQEKGDDNIQKLLAKILPAVIKSFDKNVKVGDSAVTKVKTKPTKKVSTKPTALKSTPTSQMPPSTTKPSNDNIVDIMKNMLPLLLKKVHEGNSDLIEGVKPNPMAKTQPLSPKQRSVPLKKTTAEKPSLKSLLSSLGIGNLASDSLSSTLVAKGATVTKKPEITPTQRQTMALFTPTVLPKTAVQQHITRPKPTSAVPTIQAPPPPSQPDAVRHSESPLSVQSIPLSASEQAFSPELPISASPATPLSVLLPMPPPPSTPRPARIPALQRDFPPQGNGNNLTPYTSHINSDPYSRSVLCFGDSLTSGYYNHGHSFHPYSQRLSQLLNSDGRLKYYVQTSGKVREMAHGSMARRLPQVLGNSSRVDWVIILGGTNDVAHVKNFGDDDSFMNQLISVWKPRIVRDIEVLHEISHKFGARTMVLTIPESAYEAWPNFKTLWVMRRRINQDLRDYARRSQGSTVLCDLAAKLPRHSLSPQAQALLWNDHLHLTPYGYDKMADIVYQCLKPYLSK